MLHADISGVTAVLLIQISCSSTQYTRCKLHAFTDVMTAKAIELARAPQLALCVFDQQLSRQNYKAAGKNGTCSDASAVWRVCGCG